jgi:DNA-binding response OmpR family regulator
MNTVAEHTILVADDDEHILELVSLYLRRAGYQVVTARDGDEALAREKDHRPDLLILDVMMPGPDGLQVARALRQKGDVPIVLLTARGSDVDKIAGLRLGADDYVTKPFNPMSWSRVGRSCASQPRGTPGARTVTAATS